MAPFTFRFAFWITALSALPQSMAATGTVQGPLPRIIGGSSVSITQFPWMSVVLANHSFCGGTIIDPLHIVTAAHCVDDIASVDAFRDLPGHSRYVRFLRAENISVVAGRDAYMYLNSRPEPGEQRVQVSAAIYHSRYELDAGEASNDIALLRLQRPLINSTKVSPLSLPPPFAAVPAMCTVAGWGYVTDYETTPGGLMAVTMRAYNRTGCLALESSMYFSDRHRYGVDLADDLAQHTMCLANPLYGGKETCNGDSGGPTFCRDSNGNYQLMGVVSWGYGRCPALRAFPSVMTYVPAYLDWISETKSDLASPCSALPCPVLSTCHDSGSTYTCVCVPGLSGPLCDKCGQILTATVGSLTSVNYPSNYPSNITCQWTITASSSSFVQLNFSDINIEFDGSCRWDYVEVRRENALGQRLLRVCGTTLPEPIVSNTSLFVLFRSDLTYQNRGFRASYTTLRTVTIPIIFSISQELYLEVINISSAELALKIYHQVFHQMSNPTVSNDLFNLNISETNDRFVFNAALLVPETSALQAIQVLTPALINLLGNCVCFNYHCGACQVQAAGLNISYNSRPCDLVKTLALCPKLECNESNGEIVCRSGKDSNSESSGLSTGTIIVIAVVSPVAIAAIGICIYKTCKYLSNKNTQKVADSGVNAISNGSVQPQGATQAFGWPPQGVTMGVGSQPPNGHYAPHIQHQ